MIYYTLTRMLYVLYLCLIYPLQEWSTIPVASMIYYTRCRNDLLYPLQEWSAITVARMIYYTRCKNDLHTTSVARMIYSTLTLQHPCKNDLLYHLHEYFMCCSFKRPTLLNISQLLLQRCFMERNCPCNKTNNLCKINKYY